MNIYWNVTLICLLLSFVSGFVALKKDTKYYRAVTGGFVISFVALSAVGVFLDAITTLIKVAQ